MPPPSSSPASSPAPRGYALLRAALLHFLLLGVTIYGVYAWRQRREPSVIAAHETIRIGEAQIVALATFLELRRGRASPPLS